MSDLYTDRLSEYLDGELPERERLEVEGHLATCEVCRETLDQLLTVVEKARTAPLTPPTQDLWPTIAARIGAAAAEDPENVATPAPRLGPAAPRRAVSPRPSSWFGWRFSLTLPQAAAMAATLMVVAGASVWMALGRGLIPATPGPATIAGRDVATPVSPDGASPNAASPNLAAGDLANPTAVQTRPGETSSEPRTDAAVATFDTRYDATVAELQRLLAEDRSRLSPRTIQVLERNLATIDRALADARRAVEADPSSMYLRNHLASVMRRKVDLLRTATMIASDQG